MKKWRCRQCRRLHFRDCIVCSSCGAPRDDSQSDNTNKRNMKLRRKTDENKEKNEALLAKEVQQPTAVEGVKPIVKKQTKIEKNENLNKIEMNNSESSDGTDRYYMPPDYYLENDGKPSPEYRQSQKTGDYYLDNDGKPVPECQQSRDDDDNIISSKVIIDSLDLVEDDNILYYPVDLDCGSVEEAIKRQYREDTDAEKVALKRISRSIVSRDACAGCQCGGLVRSDSLSSLSSLTPEYKNRLRDFKYAREKRQLVYGDHTPWGILGMFEFLAGIRTDIEWADEICRRRDDGEPYISWSTFDSKKNKTLNKPLFTYCLVGICTIMMIDAIRLNGWQFESLKINPMLGPSAEVLLYQGAKSTDEIVNQGEYGRLISPMFLHAGIIHYMLNMLALRAIGCAVEQSHGTLAAAVIFCVPAIGGTILSALFLPEYISVGASGGIFGFIGACLADIAMNWTLLFSKEVNLAGSFIHHIMMVFWLILDILLNCMIGLTPFVDNFNHMGGLLYGFVCGLALMDSISMNPKSPTENRSHELKKKFRMIACSLIITFSLVSSSIVLFNGDGETSPCPSCKYASCVEFPPWKDMNSKWWYCDACGDTTADVSIRNDDEHYYSDMILHCPDGSKVDLDISDLEITDQSWLEGHLPTFCRNYCDDITY